MNRMFEKIIAFVRGRKCWRCGGRDGLRPRISGASQPGLECAACRDAYVRWKYADMHMTEMMFRGDGVEDA
jgi:hypothetical protein